MNQTRRIGGHVSTSGGLKNAITNSQNIGGNCLQIFAGSPRMWARRPYTAEEVSEFLSLQRTLDISPVFIHALYLVNLASDNPDLVQKSISSLVTDLANGEAIGSAGVIVHIGSHQGRGYDSVRTSLIKNLQDILAQTQNISLILENDAGQNGKIGSFEEIADLISAVASPRLGFCLDTAHTFESGVDLRDMSAIQDLVETLTTLELLNRLSLIHLNDSRTPCGSGRDMHANIGMGEIGDTGIQNIVCHPKFVHLPLILEVPGLDGTGPDKPNIERVQALITRSE